MHISFLYQTPSGLITLVLVLAMILVVFAGHKFRQLKDKKGVSSDGIGTIEGSLLGLMALLLSFTFNLASTRHDDRVHVMILEANAFHTAVLRADLFPDSVRNNLRQNLKSYLDSRIELYDAGIDTSENSEAQKHSAIWAKKLWHISVKEAQSQDPVLRNSATLMISALNDMLTSASARKYSREFTIPDSILLLMFALCISSSFIVGYGMKSKVDFVLAASFSLMIAMTVFSILDLDRPHRGFITLDNAENSFVEMKQLFTDKD